MDEESKMKGWPRICKIWMDESKMTKHKTKKEWMDWSKMTKDQEGVKG